jgi:transposase-like protein
VVNGGSFSGPIINRKTMPIRCPKCHKFYLFMREDFKRNTLTFKCGDCGYKQDVSFNGPCSGAPPNSRRVDMI